MCSKTPPDHPAKAALFCPECGHQSRPDGDWTHIVSGNEVHYRCPDCRTEVTVRPRSSTGTTSGYAFWQTWTSSVEKWQSRWWDSLLHP